MARPWWNTALLAPLFISSALVSGTALVLVVTRLAQRFASFRPPANVVPDLGRLAPLFWAEVVFGLVVPFVIFAVPRFRARAGLLTAASTLALLGVFFKRINILLPGMFEPLIGLAPGVPGGRPGQAFRPDEIYVPTWVEWGVLIGIAAFAATLVTIGIRRLVAPPVRCSR